VRSLHMRWLKHFRITSAIGAGNPKIKKKASSLRAKNKIPLRSVCAYAIHFIIIICLYHFPKVFRIKLARHFYSRYNSVSKRIDPFSSTLYIYLYKYISILYVDKYFPRFKIEANAYRIFFLHCSLILKILKFK